MNAPLLIGHRGLPARFPDNSLAGVRAALTAGADGVEVDVRLCAEGDWVCHHDRSRGGRPLNGWPARELRRAGVATLAEIVAAVGHRWLFVEVKPLPARDLDAATPELISLLVPRAHTTKVLSSSPLVLGRVEAALPGVGRSLVFAEIPTWLPLGVELSPRHTLVEALLGEGRSLHPWTVDRPGRQRELIALGVASLTTNDVVRAVETLRG